MTSVDSSLYSVGLEVTVQVFHGCFSKFFFFFPGTMLMFFASVERSSYRNLLCSLSCVLQIVSHQIMVEILEYFFMQVPTCHN